MTDRPVLVVEDDPAMRQTIRWTLEAEGFVVAEAGSAEQALSATARQRPALVVLDYGLPDRDGGAVADELRARLPSPPPIVVVTADGRAAEKAARVGAVAYLHKPFDLDDLLATVRRTLDG
jgi:DNA-binding response OmpR family regulator